MNNIPPNADENWTSGFEYGSEADLEARIERYHEGLVKAFADLKKRAEEYEKEHGKPLPLPKIKH